ncbi:MAG: thioredoxin family protein [Bacteroidaceae bacterium]|nr:thioredoxin family protein [Bacteroidaceae bacterium]
MKRLILMAVMAMMVVLASAQTTKKVYDEEINPNVLIEQAVTKTKANGKFVMCQVGGNWCPWCLKFAAFITADSEISQLIADNFEYIHVNYDPRRSGGEEKTRQATQMLQRLSNPERFGFPVFVVLNSEGKVIHIQDSSFLEEGDGYNKEKVMRFFKNWTPEVVK